MARGRSLFSQGPHLRGKERQMEGRELVLAGSWVRGPYLLLGHSHLALDPARISKCGRHSSVSPGPSSQPPCPSGGFCVHQRHSVIGRQGILDLPCQCVPPART